MTSRYASRVFAVAGILNVLVGTAGFVAPQAVVGRLGMPLPPNPVFLHLAMWLIALLGLGYLLVALHPERNRDLMWVGAIGKAMVLPIMLAGWRRGDIGVPGVVTGAGDLVFAILFLDVIRRLGPAGATRDPRARAVR
jgi:hypothetical protein